MFTNFFRSAWRQLRHNKLFSLINTGSLSIAMTVAVFMLLWVQNESRFDHYHQRSGDIFFISTSDNRTSDQRSQMIPLPLYRSLKSNFSTVEAATAAVPTRYQPLTIKTGDQVSAETNGLFVDSNWFRIFHYEFLEGNSESFNANTHSVILTESRAAQLLGKAPYTGRMLQVDSSAYTVAGVLKDLPANSSFPQDFFLPLSNPAMLRDMDYWGMSGLLSFVRLTPDADPALLSRQITDLYAANKVTSAAFTRQAELIPLTQLHFIDNFTNSQFLHGSKKSVYIFSALAVLLLLAASINFVNLSVARAGLRSREIGMRKVTGASRRQLFLQLMTEALFTSLLSLVITVALLYLLLPVFNNFTGISFRLNLVSPSLLFILLGTLVTVVLLTGIYPAMLLSSFKPVSLFNERGALGIKRSSLQTVLVTGQFVLAIVMISGTLVIYRQLEYVQQQDPGYNREQIFSFRLPFKKIREMKMDREQKKGYLSSLKHELLSSSAITSVSRVNFGSLIDNQGNTGFKIRWQGQETSEEKEYLITQFMVDSDFTKIVDLRFLEGGWFAPSQGTDKLRFILNESAVRFFGLQHPVAGTRFSSMEEQGVIAGVVKDFPFRSVHESVGPMIIVEDNYDLGITLLVKTMAGNVKQGLAHTEKLWKSYFPGEPSNFRFLDQEFGQLYKKDRQMLRFSFLFGGLSILLSCMGLLGISVFAARQRRQEISIRKVLGASSGRISVLLSRQFLKPVFIALILAVPVSYQVASQWLKDYAYRISFSWLFIALPAALIILISLLTITAQALRAAIENPIRALRKE